jgi:hypothetical protein
MKQAAAQLQALDGTLSRACDGSESFQAEAVAIRDLVRRAATDAADLAKRMRVDDP